MCILQVSQNYFHFDLCICWQFQFIPCLIIKIISEIENFLLSEAKDLIRSVHSMLQVRKITSILTSSFWRLRPQTPAFVDNIQDLYDV